MRAYLTPWEQKLYGGMNDTFDEELVSKYEGMLVQNCVIRTVGAVTGRAGATLVGDDTGNVKVLGWGNKRNGTRFMTRIVDGASVSKVQLLSGVNWGDVTSATLTKNRDVYTTECGNGSVYYFDGDATHSVGKFDGTTWSTVAGIPKGRWTAYWKEFFWVAGVEALPKRLYFSNIGAPETWTASDYIDFPHDITSVTPYFDRLVIGTKYSVYYIVGSGSSDFVVSGEAVYIPTGFDFGIVSHESVQIVDNELWGMDNEGRIRKIFRSANDVVFGGVISDKINSLIAGLNKTALAKCTAAFIDGYYIFYAPNGSDTENSVGAYFDTRATLPQNVSSWIKHTGWTPSHFCVYDASNKPELYWGNSGNDSLTWKWAGTSDAGTAIVMRWQGRRNDNGLPNRPKLYRWGKQQYEPIGAYTGAIKADIDSRGQNTLKTVSFAGTGDLLGSTFVLGTSVLGGASRLSDTFYFKDGGDDIVGKTLQMELYASYTLAIPIWYKQTYQYKALRYR